MRIITILPVLYFVVTFSLSMLFLCSTKKQKADIIQTITKTHGVSKMIIDVTAENDVITIKLNDYLDDSTILESFSLKTKWEFENIYFPPNSFDILSNTNKYVKIRFFLPIVDTYQAELICENRIFPLNLTLTDFSDDTDAQYSQIKCHGHYFGTRWIEAKNLYFVDHTFFFYSRAQFKFPNPFVLPGSRAPPFDKITDRFAQEPIVTNISFNAIPRGDKTVSNGVSIIYGTFYNFYMLWHMIYDFFIPLYSFLNVRHKIGTHENRKLYVRSDGFWRFQDLAKCITSKDPVVLEYRNNPIFFPYSIIGCDKLEADIDPFRTFEQQSIMFKYNFNRSTAPGFREDVIKYNGITVTEPSAPLVLFIKRGGLKRDIKNIDRLIELSKEICNFCDIRAVELQNMEIKEQIQLIAPAQVLIGFHGSGLSHVAWMQQSEEKRPTHMIEILPYGYDCRDWYQTAADVAGVQYHMMMNRNPVMPEGLNPSDQNHLRDCWKKNSCGNTYCHDRLRDQFVDLEENIFVEEFRKITETISKARAT